MNTAVIDLTYGEKVIFKLNFGVIYQIYFKPSNPLDINYTLTIKNHLNVDVVYNVANGGITLDAVSNSFILNINGGDFIVGNYKGKLESDSRQAGTYLFLEVEIIVKQN